MRRRPRLLTYICLIGLLASLLLAGAILVVRRRAAGQVTTTSYTPLSGAAEWEGDWEFSELGADPSEAGTERVAIPFVGTDLALRVRRGDYRGNFFVSVDGEPANQLPRDGQVAYLVLTSPDYAVQVATIPVAAGLDDGPHVAIVVADRGWDQWPLVGWTVSRTPDMTLYRWVLRGLAVVALSCLAGLVWWWGKQEAGGRRQEAGSRKEEGSREYGVGSKEQEARSKKQEAGGRKQEGSRKYGVGSRRQEAGGREQEAGGREREAEGRKQGRDKRHPAPSLLQSAICNLQSPFSILHSPFSILHSLFSILQPRSSLALPTILLATATFYLSPWPPLTLASGLALAALVLLRLDLGLALVAGTAPFYMHPRSLFGKAFSMAEILTLLCAASWGLRMLARWRPNPTPPPTDHRPQSAIRNLQSPTSILHSPLSTLPSPFSILHSPFSLLPSPPSPLDLAALFFVLVAIASVFAAEHRHVALRELRVVVLEPALFYLMLRTSRLGRSAIWRVVDFFVLGGVVVALIGLVQYGLGVDVITAEEGFRRLRSVYGSPNNAGLYLGRVLPVLVAVALFGAARGRRVAYGLAAVPVGLAALLSFSKGALILGLPLSLLALGLLAGGRWSWAALGAVAVAAVAAIPLLRTPRFASLLDTRSGTTFFRLQLWRSAWMMFRDHLALGVGLDNFLYQYRSRYILPAAWQEPDLSHPHNVLLDYASRLGLCGLAAGAWLQVAFWRLALPLRRLVGTFQSEASDRRALALGLMGSMVDFLAHGLVDASYFVIDLAFMFFLALGLVQWLARSKTDELET